MNLSSIFRNKMSGFTLIEVLVALAILAAGISVIFQMFQQSGITANRVHQVQQSVDTQQSIFMELSHINPAENQNGVGMQGAVSFTWQATPISPLLRVRSEDGLNPNHVQIYQVVVSYQQDGQVKKFEFEQMSWEKKDSASR